VDSHPATSTHKPPLPNSFWVQPGRLLAGEYPGALTPELTRARLERLLESGINSFLDLTEPGERDSYASALPRDIDYAQLPIVDHGVPERPAMVEILAYLCAALGAGRVVYLHCRAGIGRTTMVVGCLLAEQGRAGEEALLELNRLWQQSARAIQWSAVPETVEQADFVRHWVQTGVAAGDPLLEPSALAAAGGLRARFHGALLGLATGDAVAAATQYGRPGRFTPVGDLLGGGPFDLPRGAWSDDTAMALCLAESLIECGGFDARDQVERYRRWQREGYPSATGQCLGITAATARALASAHWRRQPFSGTHDPAAQDPEALSRVAPVAMYFFTPGKDSAELAAEAARTTCQVPAVLAACRALAAALHAALSGEPKAAILARPRPTLISPAGVTPAVSSTDTAFAALAAALQAFAHTANFRDGVLAAANLGGSSDVVAAVCGALAGAHYGAAAIPAAWRNSLIKSQLIEESADRLLAHALLELGG
jgi:ADP-ribosylglycohydrolase